MLGLPTPIATHFLPVLLLLLSFSAQSRLGFGQVRADPQLVYVDDENGDAITGLMPTYATQNASVAWNQGATCTICAIKLDTGQVWDGTYHDITSGGTYYPEADLEFAFTGYTVNVYFVLAGDNLADDIVVDTTVDILIDDVLVSTFAHDASQFSDYQYNQTIYENASMPNTNHTITIRTAGNEQSVILFDYLTYTKDDDTVVAPGGSASSTGTSTGLETTSETTSQGQIQTGLSSSSSNSSHSSKSSAGAIAGGVVGGICALLALGALILFFLRRRKSATTLDSNTALVHPFDTPNQTQTLLSPDSNAAVVVPITEANIARKVSLPLVDGSSQPRVLAMPYSTKEPAGWGAYGSAYPYGSQVRPYAPRGLGVAVGEQPQLVGGDETVLASASGRQIQEQMRYLLAEVDRLRMHAELSQGRASSSQTATHTHTSDGGDRASLIVENTQPPEYTKDVRMVE